MWAGPCAGTAAALEDDVFDHDLRAHRNAEELIKRGESKTLEFTSTSRERPGIIRTRFAGER